MMIIFVGTVLCIMSISVIVEICILTSAYITEFALLLWYSCHVLKGRLEAFKEETLIAVVCRLSTCAYANNH